MNKNDDPPRPTIELSFKSYTKTRDLKLLDQAWLQSEDFDISLHNKLKIQILQQVVTQLHRFNHGSSKSKRIPEDQRGKNEKQVSSFPYPCFRRLTCPLSTLSHLSQTSFGSKFKIFPLGVLFLRSSRGKNEGDFSTEIKKTKEILG